MAASGAERSTRWLSLPRQGDRYAVGAVSPNTIDLLLEAGYVYLGNGLADDIPHYWVSNFASRRALLTLAYYCHFDDQFFLMTRSSARNSSSICSRLDQPMCCGCVVTQIAGTALQGARTQLTNLVAAVFCFLTLVLLTPLFRGMPHPTLAAIVIAAMLHLSKPGYLRDLLARTRLEFALAAIVIAGELTLGVPHGIALGVALSLLMLIYRTSHPEGAVLCQLPGTEAYRDVRRHPEARTFPGLLIWRVGGDLFFASIGHLVVGLNAALAAARPPAKHVLVDADSLNFIDASACDALLSSIKQLQSQGITIAFARVRDEVRERMRLWGIEAPVGSANFYERVTDGVRAWQQPERSDAVPAGPPK